MTAPIPAGAAAAPPVPPPPPPPPPPAPDVGTQSQFSAQLHKPAEVAQPPAAQQVDPSQKIEQTRQTIDSTRVTPTGKTDGAAMNPFKRMDRVMADFDKFMQTADKLPPDQRMGQLFQFQVQVQRASFDVQLVSKVVEHATSGARTILQTQA